MSREKDKAESVSTKVLAQGRAHNSSQVHAKMQSRMLADEKHKKSVIVAVHKKRSSKNRASVGGELNVASTVGLPDNTLKHLNSNPAHATPYMIEPSRLSNGSTSPVGYGEATPPYKIHEKPPFIQNNLHTLGELTNKDAEPSKLIYAPHLS